MVTFVTANKGIQRGKFRSFKRCSNFVICKYIHINISHLYILSKAKSNSYDSILAIWG